MGRCKLCSSVTNPLRAMSGEHGCASRCRRRCPCHGDLAPNPCRTWRERRPRPAGPRSTLFPTLAIISVRPQWWRGLATLTLLCGAALAPSAGLQADCGWRHPLHSIPPIATNSRAQMIIPLALGARHRPPHGARPTRCARLRRTPERPQIELDATLGSGDSFARLLERSGVGGGEAQALASQVASAVPLADIAPGTRIDIIAWPPCRAY